MPTETPPPGGHFETQAIRTQAARSQHREHSVPVYLTSSFVFEDAEQMRAMFANELPGDVYSRYSNPNTNEFITKLAALEGCEAGVATASGMSAVFVSMAALLKSGDHVLACNALFGSTHSILEQILPRWGISHSYVDIYRPETWEQHVRPNTRMLVVETPSNPGVDLIDLAWMADFCKAHSLVSVVDNCFATPYLQRPADFGIDIVTHSATKFIDGQGRTLGGAVLGRPEHIDEIFFFCRHTGPALSPFNAWVLSKSLETLGPRMDRHCANALEIAQWLEVHPKVARVKYPFLGSHPQVEIAKKQMRQGGGVLNFELKGGLAAGQKFLDGLQVISRSANLGDTRTIATHPTTTTHARRSEEERQAVGITPGLVRIAVGLEHRADLIQDLEQALAGVA